MSKMRKCLMTLACALLGVCAVGFSACKKEAPKPVEPECKTTGLHDWRQVEEKTQEPTCTTEGLKEYICNACGDIKSEPISAKGHSYGPFKVTKTATCTEKGKQEKTCGNCGDVQSEEIAVNAKNHPNGLAWKTILEPTCEATGKRVLTCEYCRIGQNPSTEKDTTVVVLEKLGHNWQHEDGDGNIVLDYCAGHYDFAGKFLPCSGSVAVLDEEGNPVLDEEGNQVLQTLEASKDLQYELTEDGTGYMVIGVGNCFDEKIYIPSHYDGGTGTWLPVVEVSAAFTNFTGIKRLEIINATRIADGACSNCINLKEVVMGTVLHIGTIDVDSDAEELPKGVFTNCKDLSVVELSSELLTIGVSAFDGCQSLKEVYIPRSVTVIGDYSFNNCVGLQTVIIGESDNGEEANTETNVETIGNYAFNGCTSLNKVILGYGVKNLGEYAFAGCKGVLDLNVPDTVTDIGEGVFSNCSALKTITFSVINPVASELITIGKDAFSNCSALEKITLSNKLETVEEGAFYGATKLSKVIISSIVDWCNINFSNAEANPLSNGAMLYLEGYEDPSKALTKIEIPARFEGEEVTKIGAYVFANYKAMTELVIGENIKTIGASAFYGCSGLTKVYYNAIACEDCAVMGAFLEAGDANKDANGNVISGKMELVVGVNVTRIPAYLFNANYPEFAAKLSKVSFVECADVANCEEEVHADNQCVEISKYAFANCATLSDITLGSNVSTLGDNVFANCKAISSLYVSEKVTEIGAKAFAGCNISSATIPASVSKYIPQTNLTNLTITGGEIEEKAFDNCAKLSRVFIEENVTSIGKYAFAKCSGLLTVEIKIKDDAATESIIDEYAFVDCRNLKSVGVLSGIDKIGMYAFYNCVSLSNAELVGAMTEIGMYAFKNCTGLTSVTIGENVNKIEMKAFENCSALSSADFKNRFDWMIDGAVEPEWTTNLAEKSTAAQFLRDTYVDGVWECVK